MIGKKIEEFKIKERQKKDLVDDFKDFIDFAIEHKIIFIKDIKDLILDGSYLLNYKINEE